MSIEEEPSDSEPGTAFPELDEQDDSSDETRPNPSIQASTSERRSHRHIWLISYSDFMTILMIFFLVLYGYTYLAKASLHKKIKHREAAFADVLDRLNNGAAAGFSVQQDPEKAIIHLPERVMFGSGNAALTSEARTTLALLADSIKLIDNQVIVQGHTDNRPVVGKAFNSNWELSAARAFSVIEFLTKSGVAPDRLSAWGFGENRPAVANDTAENRAMNRRIEIVILKSNSKTT